MTINVVSRDILCQTDRTYGMNAYSVNLKLVRGRFRDIYCLICKSIRYIQNLNVINSLFLKRETTFSSKMA